MQIRLSAKNLELLEGEGVELKNKSINEFFEEVLGVSRKKEGQSGFKEILMKELSEIKDLIKGSGLGEVLTPVPMPPYPDRVNIKSITGINLYVTDKQKAYGDTIISKIIGGISDFGFNEGQTKHFNSLPEVEALNGDLKEYVREGVAQYVRSNSDRLDFTCFIF